MFLKIAWVIGGQWCPIHETIEDDPVCVAFTVCGIQIPDPKDIPIMARGEVAVDVAERVCLICRAEVEKREGDDA